MSGLINEEIKNKSSANIDPSEEDVSTPLIAHRDTVPIFLAHEPVFNLVTLISQLDIVSCPIIPFAPSRNTRED